MEQKIMEVMRRMQDILSEEQLRELQSALRVTFDGCELQSTNELMVMDDSCFYYQVTHSFGFC